MSSVLPSTGNATDSSEDTKIWRPEKTDTSAGKKWIGVMNVTLLRRSLDSTLSASMIRRMKGSPQIPTSMETSSRCRNPVLGIAHPRTLRCAATVGCAAGFSYNGIHRSYRCGGLLRSVSVLWRDRKLDDAQMPKEVTRKTYFRHSAGQSSSLLVSFGNQRSRGKHTGSKRTTRHARARPPLRTPTLRYTSESRHLCQRTFEDSHTSHLPIPKPHRIAPNGFRLIVEWLNTQTTEYRHRL